MERAMKRAHPDDTSEEDEGRSSSDDEEVDNTLCNEILRCGPNHTCRKPARHPGFCGLGNCPYIRMHQRDCGHQWLGPCDLTPPGVGPMPLCDKLCLNIQKCSHICQRPCYACDGECEPLDCDKCQLEMERLQKELFEQNQVKDDEESMTSTSVSSGSADEGEDGDGEAGDSSSGTSSDESSSFVSWCRGIFTINPDVNGSDDDSQEDTSANFIAQVSSTEFSGSELNIDD